MRTQGLQRWRRQTERVSAPWELRLVAPPNVLRFGPEVLSLFLDAGEGTDKPTAAPGSYDGDGFRNLIHHFLGPIDMVSFGNGES